MQTYRFGLVTGLKSSPCLAASHRLVPSHRVLIKRTVKIESLQPSKGLNILNGQRLRRPCSPTFTIYQPQLTWYPSIVNRFAGVGLAVLLYGLALAYLVAPETFHSKKIVDSARKVPTPMKVAAKVILAAPFTFHSFNGIRHLVWDVNKFMTLKGCYQTGYAVLGATAISTVVLVIL